MHCDSVSKHPPTSPGRHHNLQDPQLPVLEVLEELGPCQRVGLSVSSVDFDARFDEIRLTSREKLFPLSLVGKIDYEEPGDDGDDLCQQTLNDLSTWIRARSVVLRVHRCRLW